MKITADMLKHDFFETEYSFVQTAINLVPKDHAQWVLDPCAGTGLWGKAARQRWPNSTIVGVEIRPHTPAMKCYDYWLRTDFLPMSETRLFDVVVANPPFSLAEEFVRKAMSVTVLGGYIVMLTKINFLASLARYPFFKFDCPPRSVHICSDRPSFSGDGKTGIQSDYCFVVWQRGYLGQTTMNWSLSRPRNQHLAYKQLMLFQEAI